mmetsp:Transcript_87735/g.237862  ORF Transcript_87735/g.237862 Transcript_87735/m.237862 type:complete len:331 (+) Transcript_87735:2-994(+)
MPPDSFRERAVHHGGQPVLCRAAAPLPGPPLAGERHRRREPGGPRGGRPRARRRDPRGLHRGRGAEAVSGGHPGRVPRGARFAAGCSGSLCDCVHAAAVVHPAEWARIRTYPAQHKLKQVHTAQARRPVLGARVRVGSRPGVGGQPAAADVGGPRGDVRVGDGGADRPRRRGALPPAAGPALPPAGSARHVQPARAAARAGLPHSAGRRPQRLQRARARRSSPVPGPHRRVRAHAGRRLRRVPGDAVRGAPLRLRLDLRAVGWPVDGLSDRPDPAVQRAAVRDLAEEPHGGLQRHVRVGHPGGLLRGLLGARGPGDQRPGPGDGPGAEWA